MADCIRGDSVQSRKAGRDGLLNAHIGYTSTLCSPAAQPESTGALRVGGIDCRGCVSRVEWLLYPRAGQFSSCACLVLHPLCQVRPACLECGRSGSTWALRRHHVHLAHRIRWGRWRACGSCDALSHGDPNDGDDCRRPLQSRANA